MCLGTNSRALSYCQRGFTGFTFSGAAFATANALQGERARGCRNEQVLVPASLIPPPGAHPSAPHARLREPNPVPPPSFFAPCISPTSPAAPLCLSAKPTHSHRAARSRVPPAPHPRLPAPTCLWSWPVCSNWDEDPRYIEVICLEEMS